MTQLQLRIPQGIHERVKDAAIEDRRSLNGELLWLIEQGLARRQAGQMGQGDTNM